MTIPHELAEQIRHACEEQGLDAAHVINGVEELVSNDSFLDYNVCVGPGLGQEELLLDIWVVGERGLYCYSKLKGLSGGPLTFGSITFLDTISNMGLVELEDARSPLVLIFGREAESGRLFGKADDREQMERFRGNVAKARLRSMGLEGGQQCL